jgi:hypothetical protein
MQNLAIGYTVMKLPRLRKNGAVYQGDFKEENLPGDISQRCISEINFRN